MSRAPPDISQSVLASYNKRLAFPRIFFLISTFVLCRCTRQAAYTAVRRANQNCTSLSFLGLAFSHKAPVSFGDICRLKSCCFGNRAPITWQPYEGYTSLKKKWKSIFGSPSVIIQP